MHFRQICDQPGASTLLAVNFSVNCEKSASGTGARFGGTANLDAFTETRWVTIRGDIARYPF